MSRKDPFLADLEAEERRIQKQIDALKAELRTVERIIFRRKAAIYGEVIDEKPNEKNIDKLFFESLITDALASNPSGLRTSEVYKKVSDTGHRINYNTFRSYIVSMQRSKKIVKKDRGYKWVSVVADNKSG